MPKRKATPAQLKALAKGRAAMAKKRSKMVSKKPKYVKKTTRKVAPKKRASIRSKIASREPGEYVVVITTTKGEVGYLSGWSSTGPKFDTLISKAITYPVNAIKTAQMSVYTTKPRGVAKVDTLKK